jgi:hypothetical protein
MCERKPHNHRPINHKRYLHRRAALDVVNKVKDITGVVFRLKTKGPGIDQAVVEFDGGKALRVRKVSTLIDLCENFIGVGITRKLMSVHCGVTAEAKLY